MDGTLNRVPVVINKEDHRGEPVPENGPELLHGQLRRTVTNEQHPACLLIRQGRPKQSWQRVSDRTPQRHTNKPGLGGE